MPFFNVEKKKKPKILYLTVKTLKQLYFSIYTKEKKNTIHTTFKSNKLQKNDKKLRSKISDEKN